MSKETIIIPKGHNVGDIFYFTMCNKYYFIQIVNILLVNNYWPQPTYCYFIVLLEKTFRTLPATVSELDLVTIYHIKYRPKNSILYIMYTNHKNEITTASDIEQDYNKYKNIKLNYFGNTKPAEHFVPEIILPQAMPINCCENEEGIEISPQCAWFTYVFSRIEQDEEHKNKKIKKATLIYFEDWLEDVEGDVLIKLEKIFQQLEHCEELDKWRMQLKKSVIKINKLDEKYNFITTIEAEGLFDKYAAIIEKLAIPQADEMQIIEKYREW